MLLPEDGLTMQMLLEDKFAAMGGHCQYHPGTASLQLQEQRRQLSRFSYRADRMKPEGSNGSRRPWRYYCFTFSCRFYSCLYLPIRSRP